MASSFPASKWRPNRHDNGHRLYVGRGNKSGRTSKSPRVPVNRRTTSRLRDSRNSRPVSAVVREKLEALLSFRRSILVSCLFAFLRDRVVVADGSDCVSVPGLLFGEKTVFFFFFFAALAVERYFRERTTLRAASDGTTDKEWRNKLSEGGS